MGEQEISQYLTHLAVEKKVAASTQNQAMSAIIFLYREVIQKDISQIDNVIFSKKPSKLSFALQRKYPNANREWCWQYVFPSN